MQNRLSEFDVVHIIIPATEKLFLLTNNEFVLELTEHSIICKLLTLYLSIAVKLLFIIKLQ